MTGNIEEYLISTRSNVTHGLIILTRPLSMFFLLHSKLLAQYSVIASAKQTSKKKQLYLTFLWYQLENDWECGSTSYFYNQQCRLNICRELDKSKMLRVSILKSPLRLKQKQNKVSLYLRVPTYKSLSYNIAKTTPVRTDITFRKK